MAKKKPSRYKPGSRKSAMGTAASRAEGLPTRSNTKKPKSNPTAYWNARTSVGRDKMFTDPESLYKAIIQYFEYHQTQPWHKKELKVINGKAKIIDIPMLPPFTWEGLCIYLGISTGYFRTFKVTIKQDDPQRSAFLAVIEWADNTIRKNKFDGASIGAFNAQLMSYDLGIRKDMAQNNGGAGVVINVTESKSKDLLNETIDRLTKAAEETEDGK